VVVGVRGSVDSVGRVFLCEMVYSSVLLESPAWIFAKTVWCVLVDDGKEDRVIVVPVDACLALVCDECSVGFEGVVDAALAPRIGCTRRHKFCCLHTVFPSVYVKVSLEIQDVVMNAAGQEVMDMKPVFRLVVPVCSTDESRCASGYFNGTVIGEAVVDQEVVVANSGYGAYHEHNVLCHTSMRRRWIIRMSAERVCGIMFEEADGVLLGLCLVVMRP